MNYLLTPLDRHFDLGFGFTGNTFYNAANSLLERKDDFYFGDSPVNYLQRHAIELFLKSAIIIFHKINGNEIDIVNDKSFPKVKSSGKLKLIYKVHNIGDLYSHLCTLIDNSEDILKNKSDLIWKFSDKFVEYIGVINGFDPNSTFFRYPVTNGKNDELKSPSKISSHEALMEKIESDTGLVKAFIVLDDNDHIVNSYELRKDIDKNVSEALIYVLEQLYGFHTAMRVELTGGN